MDLVCIASLGNITSKYLCYLSFHFTTSNCIISFKFVRWPNRTLCLTQSFSLIFILNVGTSLLNQRPQALTEWSQNPQTLSPSAKELSTHSSLALRSTIKKYM